MFSDEEPDTSEPDGSLASRREAVHRLAREIAARLATAAPVHRRCQRAAGPFDSERFRGELHDIDLDRTLDALLERRPLAPEEIYVTRRRGLRRAIVLICDVSGSMRGPRLNTLAAAVGALTAALHRDLLSVVAFASDTAVLVRFGETATLEQVIDSVLALQPTGLTNVAFPLEYAASELHRVRRCERRVLLLSDCVHNAGPDPRAIASRLPRLDVLFDTTAECDVSLARDLGRIGRGRVFPVRGPEAVVAALGQILSR